jgi:hypothetical protein
MPDVAPVMTTTFPFMIPPKAFCTVAGSAFIVAMYAGPLRYCFNEATMNL